MRFHLLLLIPALMLSACITPPTSVQQPMSARPLPPDANVQTNGAIFQASIVRPLFEDRRARMVGDTLTVNLVENTKASKSSNSSASRSDGVTAALPTIAGVPGKFLSGVNVGLSGGNTFDGKGAAGANNAFTGTITVTVIETYPNGNIMVSGEKQIAINQGQEFIRFSGVVNPAYVTTANTVQSTQVADARLEYKANGYIDEAQTMGWLQRFFLNVLPW